MATNRRFRLGSLYGHGSRCRQERGESDVNLPLAILSIDSQPLYRPSFFSQAVLPPRPISDICTGVTTARPLRLQGQGYQRWFLPSRRVAHQV
jgi:hypothetical protein